jgi:TetR/AcrR family transcriptional regulator
MPRERSNRKEQILQSLADMLESSPGERITTASLAKKVGVSEAALYRHFPSKAKMFEGLIEFIEETIFTRISRILAEKNTAHERCEQILFLLLSFSEKNPGISRILIGDALAGETERLRGRVSQFYNRIDAQLKQIIREAEIRENLKSTIDTGATANLLLALADGKITQFVRSEFKRSPLEDFPAQWQLIRVQLFSPL